MTETDRYVDRVIDLVKEVTQSNALQTQSIEALKSTVSEEVAQVEANLLDAVAALERKVSVNNCSLASEEHKQMRDNARKLLTDEGYDLLSLVKSIRKFLTFATVLLGLISAVLAAAGIYSLLHGFFKGA